MCLHRYEARSPLITVQVECVCVQVAERKTQSAGPVMRRYTSVPLEGGPVMYPQPPPQLFSTPQGTPCYTCFAVPVSSSAAPVRYHGHVQPLYCVNHQLQALHLDGDASRHCSNSSSASDSSSASHSPPDTPSMPTAPHWDGRGKWKIYEYDIELCYVGTVKFVWSFNFLY